MSICIIPARGGSKRIPRKNIKDFCGRPMIEWSIRAAQAAQIFDRIILSTDDAEIAAVSRGLGAETPFDRPAHLADDFATTMDVMAHAVIALDIPKDMPVCCLYATAPFVRPEDLESGWQALQKADFALSVTEFAFPIQRALKLDAAGHATMVNPEQFKTRSQDLEDRYHDAGQFYWARAENWRKNASPFETSAQPVILPRVRVQDIDTPQDWQQAEAMFSALGLV